MGVYCFRWLRGPWVKVGSYRGRNPWSRMARRGWRSVLKPDPALDYAGPGDFELVYWSPALGASHERGVHAMFPDRFGEWIGADRLPEVLAALTALSPDDRRDGCDREAALRTRRRL